MNREFIQQCHKYKQEKHLIGGWYLSEKLDGMRAFWDGGFTRGQPTADVPFANTTKDHRRLKPPVSTGLWSRYAKPIAAPDWWLDGLPDFPLDGELYMGPGNFQDVMSTARKFEPVNSEWEGLTYNCFDLPSYSAFLAPGRINNPQWAANFEDMRHLSPGTCKGHISFYKLTRLIELGKIDLGTAHWVNQFKLPMQSAMAQKIIDSSLDRVLSAGGEGLVLRRPVSSWVARRSHDVLKMKPFHDSEATVVDYVWGKGKFENMLGCLRILWQDKLFELSGFNDEERILSWDGYEPCTPGSIAIDSTISHSFPKGSKVTFKYRELTRDGYPKEARYWRKP